MKFIPTALSLVLVCSAVSVDAQSKTRKKTGRIGEVSLAGISLYDSGQQLIKKFGSPDEILAITVGTGGGSGGSGGGSGGPAGGAGGPGGQGPSGAQGALSISGGFTENTMEGFIGDPFGIGGQNIKQLAPPGGDEGGGRDGGSPGGPGKGGSGGAGRGPGGGADNGSSSSSSSSVQFTKWVYKRANARYSFILDKYTKVVQIEAIGLNDPKVKTSRGVGFGATFGQLMQKYYEPDGYDIAGDGFIVRFLQRGKVAFRFSRLEANKPHRVTGIVVAAGKA